MKGQNAIIFCQADLIEALQVYLQEHVFMPAQKFKVVSVEPEDRVALNYKITFEGVEEGPE